MNGTSLLIGVVLSAVGFGYFVYGKKQRAPIPLVCGVILMVVPYVLPRPVVLVPVGLGFMILPLVWRI